MTAPCEGCKRSVDSLMDGYCLSCSRLALKELQGELDEERARANRLASSYDELDRREKVDLEQELKQERHLRRKAERQEGDYIDGLRRNVASLEAALREVENLRDELNAGHPWSASVIEAIVSRLTQVLAMAAHPEGDEEADNGGERCSECGRRATWGLGAPDHTYWFAPNELWNEVVEDSAVILCALCFEAACGEKGIGIGWCADRIGQIENHVSPECRVADEEAVERVAKALERETEAQITSGQKTANWHLLSRAAIAALRGPEGERHDPVA